MLETSESAGRSTLPTSKVKSPIATPSSPLSADRCLPCQYRTSSSKKKSRLSRLVNSAHLTSPRSSRHLVRRLVCPSPTAAPVITRRTTKHTPCVPRLLAISPSPLPPHQASEPRRVLRRHPVHDHPLCAVLVLLYLSTTLARISQPTVARHRSLAPFGAAGLLLPRLPKRQRKQSELYLNTPFSYVTSRLLLYL